MYFSFIKLNSVVVCYMKDVCSESFPFPSCPYFFSIDIFEGWILLELNCAINKPFGGLCHREWLSLWKLMDSFDEKWDNRGEAELPCQELRLNKTKIQGTVFAAWRSWVGVGLCELYIDVASGWPISFWWIYLLSDLFKLRALRSHSLWQTSFLSDAYRWAYVVSVTLLVFLSLFFASM